MKRQADTQLTLSVDAFGGESVNREIGARMKAARSALGLSQPAFAEAIGGSKPGIQDNEAGKTMPGGKVLYGFVRAGINANWLLTGEGPMLLEELQHKGSPAKASVLDIELMRTLMEMVEEELDKRDLDLPPRNKARILALMYDYAAKVGETDSDMLGSLLDLAA